MVIGDKRRYLTALFTLDPEKIEQVAAAETDSPAKDSAAASKCEKFNAYIQGKVDEINKTFARVQTIKKFVILPQEFSIEGDELTPTMKLKRRIVNEKYVNEIESMY